VTGIQGMRQGARWICELTEQEQQCEHCIILSGCEEKSPLCLFHTWDEDQARIDRLGAEIAARCVDRAVKGAQRCYIRSS